MQLSTRSIRLGVRETVPAGKLGCPQVDRQLLPGQSEARPSFQHPQYHLGMKGGACPDKPSTESLEASFSAQKRAERMSADRPSPAFPESPQDSFSEQTPLGHLGLEEQTGKLQKKTLPPTSLTLTSLSLRMEAATTEFSLEKP